MNTTEHYQKLKRMYLSEPSMNFSHSTLCVSERQAELTIPIQGNFFHAAKAVHGAIYFKISDDVCFLAVNSIIEDVLVLTASFNIYFTRPVFNGEITAKAKVIHESRRIFIAEAEAFNLDKQIAKASGIFMKIKTPLSDKIGYI